VTFTPTATGARTASVTITDHAPGSPQSVALSGTGIAPAVSLSANRLAFPTQLIGTSSAAAPFTAMNTGTAPLLVSSVAASGAFSQTSTCGSVAVGGSCTIQVVFSPSVKNTQGGTLSITDNAAGSPQNILLSGTGTVVNLSTNELDFGTERVGKTTRPATVALRNDGHAMLAIHKILIGGTDAASFAETSTCGATLAAGKTCTIGVGFTPQAAGAANATLEVRDDGGASPQQVELSGTGQ